MTPKKGTKSTKALKQSKKLNATKALAWKFPNGPC